MLSAYCVCCINSNALQITNLPINPDQTATATGFILFAIKNNKLHKQKREQTTMVMNSGKRV